MFSLLLSIACVAPAQSQVRTGEPSVEEEVECISVAHVGDGAELVFFWSLVQGNWTCLDHRWISDGMSISRRGDEWALAWNDENERCYRTVRTKCWVESWERESPLAEQKQRPWFRRMLCPGLRQPK